MKIQDVISYVDEIYENAFSDKIKLRWINQLEAELQTEVLLLAADGITQYTEEDMDAVLIAPAPFDKIYEEYLIWRMMAAQGEAERANNQQAILDEAWKAYARFVCETVDPKSGLAETLRYYLSAYQIAVKHGYNGTEAEWVTSLKGDKGEAGAGLNIKGQVASEAQLPDLDTSDEGVAYLVGTGFGALLYIWDGKAWFYKQPLSVKGEDFTYEDFTPEQLELLRGPRGYQGEPVNVEQVLESPDDGGINTVLFTDGKQLQVRNGTKGGKGDPGYTPQKGTDYTDGEDGGYYTLQISQVDADTAQVRYTPSKAGMPDVSAETLQLPKGREGDNGITPHIGASGNWFIGETDTGVKAQGDDYILTDADKVEIAEQAAELVDIPDSAANVKNVRSYGATGDGVTDDTAAIAAAISELAAGETLYFPAGVYRVSKVDLKSNMTVQGDGWCSVIKLIDNAPDDYTNCLDIEGKENVIIRDIKLDGNRWADGEYKQASTGASKDYRLNGIRIRASSNIRIENVWMHNNGYHGCVMTKSRNVVIDRCKVTDNGFRPIHGNTQVYNCQITNCVCENNGLGLQGGSGYENDSIFFFGMRDLVIANNIVKSNRRGCITVGTDQDATPEDARTESGNITITGNVCECYENLPYVSSTESDTGVAKFQSVGICVYGGTYVLGNVTVTGNTILRANQALWFYSQESATANIDAAVSGNTVQDCGWGIHASNVSGVVFSGNQFRGLQNGWVYGQAINDCVLTGNHVATNGINQVCRMYSSKDIAVQNNIITGDQAYAIYLPASNTGCVVTGNTMYGFTLENPITNPNGYTANNVPGTMSGDYVLTEADKQEIAALTAPLVEVPDTYTKTEINAMFGSYITDINTLVGGDA